MRKLLILFAFLIFALPAFAQSAAELYNQGDYHAAAMQYEKQLKYGKNPYLYYNLANSYFKAGDTDKAIVNYYRAFNLLPRDGDIRDNLAFALHSAGQRLVPEGMPQIAFNIYYYLSIRELGGAFWAALWLFAICFCFYVFTDKKRAGKRACVISGILLVIIALWYLVRLPEAGARKAVAIVPRAEVRSGPGESFPVSLSLPRAYVIIINDTKGDWAEIRAGGGTGWVLKKSIEEI